MKYKTLKSLLKVVKKEYDRSCEFDEKLQNLLGGNTQVLRDVHTVDDIVQIIIDEYPKSEDFIDWFVYDKYMSNDISKGETFSGAFDSTDPDREYKVNIKNLNIKNFYKNLKKG